MEKIGYLLTDFLAWFAHVASFGIAWVYAYLLRQSAENLIIQAAIFLFFGLYWFTTGKLKIVGLLVKIVWLFTITPLAIALWLFSWLINVVIEAIKAERALMVSSLIAAGFLIYWSKDNRPDMLPVALIMSFIYLYWLRYGLDEGKYKDFAFSLPKPKTTRPIQKNPLLQGKKPAIPNFLKKPTKPQIALQQAEAEQEQKPIVRLAFDHQKNSEQEAEFLTRMEAKLTEIMR